jgi:hypothetical protein
MREWKGFGTKSSQFQGMSRDLLEKLRKDVLMNGVLIDM